MCSLLQRREIGQLHRDGNHQLTEASIYLADKLLVHNNEIKVVYWIFLIHQHLECFFYLIDFLCSLKVKRRILMNNIVFPILMKKML